MTRKLMTLGLALAVLLVLTSTVASAAPPAQEGQTYVVVAKDWLSKLADKYLGNVFAWQAIVVATNEKHAEDASYARITNPDLIEVGDKLWIPSKAEADAFMAKYDLAGNYITLYQFGDQTGPYGPITAPMIDGVNDAVGYLNSIGGIRGATVRIVWADTAGKIEESVSIYNRFREADPKPILMFTYSSPETEALRDRYEEDKIPVLSAGMSTPALYPPAYAFGIVPLYVDQFGLMVDWLTENWATVKPANAGDTIKMAFVTWPGAFGEATDTPETRAYAEAKGWEIVGKEIFMPGATDVTTQLLAAQAAGANVIWTNTLATGPAQILKDIAALGLGDDMLVTGVNWALDSTVIFLAGDAAEGMIAPVPFRWWNETDHPGIQILHQQFAANERPAAYMNLAYLMTFTNVDMARQVIEKAIDDVGFANLNGEAVYNALQTIGRVEALKGVMTYNYDAKTRSTNQMRIGKVEGGQIVFITDWLTTPNLLPEEFK
ncbi:MAG: ABC transporter substrate-binding protein [Anaerolineae bacterium]